MSLAMLKEAAEQRRAARRELKKMCRESGPQQVREYLDSVPDNLFIWATITEMMYPEWGEFPWS